MLTKEQQKARLDAIRAGTAKYEAIGLAINSGLITTGQLAQRAVVNTQVAVKVVLVTSFRDQRKA